jgi:XTP/dITP diphosphohydrolase
MKLPELRRSGILIATGNLHKIRELEQLLDPFAIPVRTPASLGIRLEVEETGSTFAENAALKARAYFKAAGIPVLADDSGLMVDALHGEPGVMSARYGGEGLDDTGRLRLVLEKMRGVAPHLRRARFVCTLAFLTSQHDEIRYYEGAAEGRILLEPQGSGGFGYDPIFEDLITGRSYASLTAEEKNERSHRGRALKLFLADLQRL